MNQIERTIIEEARRRKRELEQYIPEQVLEQTREMRRLQELRDEGGGSARALRETPYENPTVRSRPGVPNTLKTQPRVSNRRTVKSIVASVMKCKKDFGDPQKIERMFAELISAEQAKEISFLTRGEPHGGQVSTFAELKQKPRSSQYKRRMNSLKRGLYR
jgi:hypothetical protein